MQLKVCFSNMLVMCNVSAAHPKEGSFSGLKLSSLLSFL